MSTGGGDRARSKGSAGSGFGEDAETETVGTLLAAIATCMTEALRIMSFADKRQWGPDEFEQMRALEEALDEAKQDFQEMGPLVNGRFYYENDRTPESLHALAALLAKFQAHTQNFRDWARHGGPINPTWARDTAHLRRQLHRAQCRAACRIFAAAQDGRRCLGAFQVHRQQQRHAAERARRAREREGMPPWQREQERQQEREQERDGVDGHGHGAGAGSGPGPGPLAEGGGARGAGVVGDGRERRPGRKGSLEALVPSCNAVGRFRVLGEESHDAAFVCDYCEGYIVWPDLQSIPSERTPLPPTAVTGYPHWQAKGVSAESGEEKVVVFPPLAIANHLPPEPGEWQAGLLCPHCDEATYVDQGEDSSELKYVQEDGGFPDLEAFRAHLEWYHTALPVPPISSLASAIPSAASNCRVM